MYKNSNYSYPSNTGSMGGFVTLGVAGALFTGSMRAAKEIRKVKQGEVTGTQAACAVAKEGVGGGLSLAVGAAVGKALFNYGPLSLLTMAVVSAGAKYVYDGLTCSCACQEEQAPVPAKAAKSK